MQLNKTSIDMPIPLLWPANRKLSWFYDKSRLIFGQFDLPCQNKGCILIEICHDNKQSFD